MWSLFSFRLPFNTSETTLSVPELASEVLLPKIVGLHQFAQNLNRRG